MTFHRIKLVLVLHVMISRPPGHTDATSEGDSINLDSVIMHFMYVHGKLIKLLLKYLPDSVLNNISKYITMSYMPLH